MNSKKKNNISKKFYNDGFIFGKIENLNSFRIIEEEVSNIIQKFLKLEKKPLKLLENLHNFVNYSQINSLRVEIYKKLNLKSWFREVYFSLAQDSIKAIVGDELAMQTNVNFSIQLPKDSSSQLSIHADSLSGESKFQVVLWVPFMNVSKTSSMYIINKKESIQNI